MSEQYDPNSMSAILTRMEVQQRVNSERLVEIQHNLAKQEARIETLERFRYWLLGAVGAGSAGGAAALSKIFGG